MNSLARFDATHNYRGRRLITAAAFPNGFFTLVFPDGSHKTFRVRTRRVDSDFAPGQRTVGLLIGPDNSHDYEDFAFIDDQGIRLWRSRSTAKLQDYALLLWQLVVQNGGDAATTPGYRVEVSKRCLCCNRRLTTPESIVYGIGPECAGRWGGQELKQKITGRKRRAPRSTSGSTRFEYCRAIVNGPALRWQFKIRGQDAAERHHDGDVSAWDEGEIVELTHAVVEVPADESVEVVFE